MSSETNPNAPAAGLPEPEDQPEAQHGKLFHLPGVIAIGAYMFLLAIAAIVYVVKGIVGPVFLILPVLFVAAGLGLLLLLRWAWALTLAAVALLAGWFFWTFVTRHMAELMVQGLINLVFFLYLIRTDVRTKLR